MTPIQQADQLWRAFSAGSITRTEAVTELRACLLVTEVGASNILDDERLPSGRYARSGKQAGLGWINLGVDS